MNQLRNITQDGLPLHRRFTVDEFEQMGAAGIIGPDERVELIDGEICIMSPAGRFHEVLRAYLAHHWTKRAPDQVLVMPEMQLRLSDHHQPVIDIGVVPFAILPPDARGPDMLLVVEIADTSLKLDTTIKAAAYAIGGVREYWVINARTRSTLIHRNPGPDGYTTKFEIPATEPITPLLIPELTIRLSDLPAAE
ncbi:MAG: Uma2 family endonuclease [Hyphomicrobiaceae bacterium]